MKLFRLLMAVAIVVPTYNAAGEEESYYVEAVVNAGYVAVTDVEDSDSWNGQIDLKGYFPTNLFIKDKINTKNKLITCEDDAAERDWESRITFSGNLSYNFNAQKLSYGKLGWMLPVGYCNNTGNLGFNPSEPLPYVGVFYHQRRLLGNVGDISLELGFFNDIELDSSIGPFKYLAWDSAMSVQPKGVFEFTGNWVMSESLDAKSQLHLGMGVSYLKSSEDGVGGNDYSEYDVQFKVGWEGYSEKCGQFNNQHCGSRTGWFRGYTPYLLVGRSRVESSSIEHSSANYAMIGVELGMGYRKGYGKDADGQWRKIGGRWVYIPWL